MVLTPSSHTRDRGKPPRPTRSQSFLYSRFTQSLSGLRWYCSFISFFFYSDQPTSYYPVFSSCPSSLGCRRNGHFRRRNLSYRRRPRGPLHISRPAFCCLKAKNHPHCLVQTCQWLWKSSRFRCKDEGGRKSPCIPQHFLLSSPPIEKTSRDLLRLTNGYC